MTHGQGAGRLLRDFGKRLRASRIAAGYESASDFARDLGIEAPAYRKYERGEAQPPIDALGRICDLTGKTADFLMFGRSTKI